MYQVLKVYFIEEEKEFFASFTHEEVEKYIKAYEKKEAAAIEEGIYVSTGTKSCWISFFYPIFRIHHPRNSLDILSLWQKS